MPSPSFAFSSTRVFRAGLVAGTLDLGLAALLQFLATGGVNMVRILHGIASGVLGPAARDGGAPSAALGLGLHLLIATIWASIFALVLQRSSAVQRAVSSHAGWIATGLAYGVVVWAGMRYVVVPLSRATPASGYSWLTAVMIAGHAALVGLPIVSLVRRRSMVRG